MSLISDLINLVDSTIRNKSTSNRIDNVEDADLRTEIINNLQSDFDITDPNDARYIKNQPTSLRVLATLIETTWSFSNSNFVLSIPQNSVVTSVTAKGIVTENFTTLDRDFVVGDEIFGNCTEDSENDDAGGIQIFKRGNTIIVNPKQFVTAEITGLGRDIINNSSGKGKLTLEIIALGYTT